MKITNEYAREKDIQKGIFWEIMILKKEALGDKNNI